MRPEWWTGGEASLWLERAREKLGTRRYALRGRDDEESFDVITDRSNLFFQGVGADKIWPATELLVDCLDHVLRAPRAEANVAIELGAGCGVAGMWLARRGWRVVLTDLPWLLPLTHLNVEANFGRTNFAAPSGDEPAALQAPRVAALRWGCDVDAASLPTPNLVIGSDVAYEVEDFGPLLATLDHLTADHAILAIPIRDGCDAQFGTLARSLGWSVNLVAPHTSAAEQCTLRRVTTLELKRDRV